MLAREALAMMAPAAMVTLAREALPIRVLAAAVTLAREALASMARCS